MANGTLDSELFILFDNWPGIPDVWCPPLDKFTGATSNNVASATAAGYRVGQKIQVYCDGSVGKAGFSTMIYLQVGTQCSTAIAAKTVCVPDSATVWYQLTNDPDSCVAVGGPLAAVAFSAITDAYYGWFWCGGVCPEQYESVMAGNYKTDGTVVAGAMSTQDSDTYVVTGFGVAVTLKGVCGYALADDTTVT